MTSSMLAGERRWASSRRGGMTVLGKVAVPKPINLPSQKLENHGLDPNVEIVPKGSLSWGSRPSSSTSNPWGSSAVSPNADGTAVSPHHSSGRPTSGSGLSRPSTAGSDRHDPSATTWGPNSRPSSASGVLTSNQSSLTSSRPLSAETRPGSSHLSRFAEPVYDHSVAWGPNGTADKLSMPSKVDDFSLSSGDFPTLGSEKDNTTKSGKPDDHGSHARPGSGSGRNSHVNDRNEMAQADHRSETVDTWRRDGSAHFDDGVHSNADKWQGDPHQFMNPNVPPQHYDAWPGPPMNAPYAAWYRGPPYPHVPHGGFPMEPYPYYRPQIPPPLPNSQSGPPPGPGPRGHHPGNGDFYRPQMPDAFMRPGMPVRPGFYPGPVPYDGYYGPPMGYNPNDRDMPFMGMPPGPHGTLVYNMCPPQNPSEHNDPHFRGGVCGPNIVSEQLDSFPPVESHGHYRVLTKREDERDADIDDDNWEHHVGKSDQNEQGADSRSLEDMPPRRNTSINHQHYPSDPVIAHPPQGPHKFKPSNESWGSKSTSSENPIDPTLIQKIEDLNAKARGSDIRGDAGKVNKLLINPKDNSEISFGSISTTEDLAHTYDKSRHVHQGVRNRTDHHSTGRLSNQDTDGWRKRTSFVGSDVAVPENHISSESESLTQMVDPADSQAQRARMREIAKQRAIELQKEEEERIREQKAKAQAKLEELNRRTLAGADGTTQTTEKSSTTVFEEDVDKSQKPTEPAIDTKAEVVAQISENSQQDIVDQPQIDAKSITTFGSDGGVNKQKRASHRSKQSVQVEESHADKSTLSGTDSKAIKKPETTETVSGEAVQSQESTLPNNSNILSEPTHQKRRNNKSSKNKHRHDDASASKEVDLVKPESPQFGSFDGKNVKQSNLDQVSSLPSNQHKPQHSRRMPRNPQANKSHVGDVAVWAPVRPQNKEEVRQDDVALPEKTANLGLNNIKSKRAEMERYVPKPVAKELAQEGSMTQPTSVSSPKRTTLEDTADIQAIPVSGPTLESKTGDYKPVKPRGTFHQREPDTKKVIHKSTGQHHKESDSVPTETGVVHEWDPADGWFMPDECPPTQSTTRAVKDEPQVTGRGKKPAHKGQRSTAKSHIESGAEVEIDQTDRPASSKDNRWQPKPQSNRGGWSGGGGQNASLEVRRDSRKYSPQVQPDEAVHDEGRRERKPASYRARTDPQYHNQGPGNMEDETQGQFDHHVSSGFRKYGGQNNRWSGQDDRRKYNNYQHGANTNANTNRERQRQNSQYEYQPVGSNNNNSNKSSHLDAPADAAAPTYKERSTGQPRRGGGNFYGRQ